MTISWKPTLPGEISRFLLTPLAAPKPPPRGLLLGTRPDGRRLIVPDSLWFSTHFHIMGASGYGKTRALQSYVAQIIMRGFGACVIDPHGDLYRLVLNFCVQEKVDPSRVVLVDPIREDWTLKLNPLQSWDGTGSGSSLAMESLVRVTGERDTLHTPRVARYLPRALRALEEAGEGLSLLADFCATDGTGVSLRQSILEKVTDRYVAREWEQFNILSVPRQRDDLDSSINRVVPFVEDARIRRMLAYPSGNLDFRALMDEGKILLCHLGNRGGRDLSRRSRQLVGCLVMQGLRAAAVRRENPTPFFVVADEFGEFITEDFADDLDSLRKFGVFYLLAHQRIDQVELVSQNVMSSVMTNAKIKLCFGGLQRLDAERMSGELFTGELDMMEVKYETQQVAFRPKLTWVEVKTESEGHVTSDGFGTSTIHGTSSGSSTFFGSEGLPFLGPDSTGSSDSSSESTVTVDCSFWSTSDSRSTSVTNTPITTYEEFLQPPAKEFFSLEEQREKKIALLMNQFPRDVAVKLPNKHVELIRTLDVADSPAAAGACESFAQASWSRCDYAVRGEQAEMELQRRLASYYLIDTVDTTFTEFDPPATPRSVEMEDDPGAADPSRVGLEPVLAEPGQGSARPDTPESAADRSLSAPSPGVEGQRTQGQQPGPVKRKRGRPRKQPPPSDLIL